MVFVTLKLSHKVFTTSPGISDYLKAKYRLKKLPSSYYHWYKGNNDLENKQINDYFLYKKLEIISIDLKHQSYLHIVEYFQMARSYKFCKGISVN